MVQKIIPVIMAGGAGRRLWPLSRSSMPKQFLPLIHALSPFQQTVLRVQDDALFEAPIVITHTDFRFFVDEQLKAINVKATILLEPARRDSAAAIAAASAYVAEKQPDALILALAADHYIDDDLAFRAHCQAACESAHAGKIITFGIKPSSVHTQYGYIQPSIEPLSTGGYAVQKFIEKPDENTARSYVDAGFLWNCGNFLFRADVMLAELHIHAPHIRQPIDEAVKQRSHDLMFERLGAAPFLRTPSISIDYAVMEKTDKAAVFPCLFAWSDLGTWDALWDISPHDEYGNALHHSGTGVTHLSQTSNSLIRSQGLSVAVHGMRDVAVIATKDAVLVMPRSQSAALKDIVHALDQNTSELTPQTAKEYRPWGYYEEVDRGGRFRVKRIVVKPDCRLSLQKHLHRSEHWVVVHGTAEVTLGDSVQLIQENESIYIPLGVPHRLANLGKIPLEVIEVQTGSYLAEDDIVRLSDDFNRR